MIFDRQGSRMVHRGTMEGNRRRVPDEMLSLVLAEVAGGKRTDWKALLHQGKAMLGGKVDDGPVYVKSGDFPTKRLTGPRLEREREW